MKSKKETGCITPPKTQRQCKLYQNIQAFTENLNRLPDAQELQKDKPRSAPATIIGMVF